MEQTLAIIKPDSVRKGYTGAIIEKIENAGFKVVAMKLTRLTPATAGKFYDVHKERGFYKELVDFMASGPCVPLILEKENAVLDFRTLIGATDPAKAAEGTIRKQFAANVGENAIHGSDSVDNAKQEKGFFFSEKEITEIHA